MDKCSICAELIAAPNTRFTKALGSRKVRNAVLSVSERFVMIPSLGALTYGHSLLVTRNHATNIFGRDDPLAIEEIRQHLKRALNLKGKTKDNIEVLCFEHGAVNACMDQQLCSTTHAHLHIVPLRSDLVVEVYKQLRGLSLDDLGSQSTRQKITQVDPYLLVFRLSDLGEPTQCLLKDASGLPSQFMRQLLAELLKLDEWDWKVNPASSAFRETLAGAVNINQSLVSTSVILLTGNS